MDQQVCLVGRVLSVTDQTMTVEASDHQQVRVNTRNGGYSVPQQSIVEIIGHVNSDNSIAEVTRSSFSDNFNLDTYDEFVKLSQDPSLQTLFGK